MIKIKKYLIILIITAFAASIIAGCGTDNYEIDESTRSVNEGTGYDNKKISWGLKNNENAAPDVPSEWTELLRRYDGYYLGDTTKKYLYLTFDEGYENGYTAQILDVLKENKVPAAFFITGPYMKTEKELVCRMVNEGHVVGNHTVNHPSMPDETDDSKLGAEITELDKAFYGATGTHMKYIRPPRGEFSERTLAISKKLGCKTVLWSSAYADWDTNKQRGAEYAYDMVMKRLHNGNIILLHAVSADNAAALGKIIKNAMEKGYEFKSLNDL